MQLVVGLGNPGDKYLGSRMNIGFRILDVIASNINIRVKTKKKKSILGTGIFENKNIVLLKPQTFVDLSGEAVLYIASFLRVDVNAIIIIHHDYRQDFGVLKIVKGFNSELDKYNVGLRSIIDELKSENFVRICVGVGPLKKEPTGEEPTEQEVKEFLKSDFELEQNIALIDVVNEAEALLRSIFIQDINDVLSRYELQDF